MSVIKKTLFSENIDKYNVLVNDTDTNSKYFKITELPDTFTGGKNAFLIQGSEYLVPDTIIKIEIKDAKGDIIYHEPGEGIVSSSINGESFVTEYYEGTSKVVSVYVYPDTSYGPCTITILGELSSYDNNGLNTPVPIEWEGQYNVKWQKQINVNPGLPNTTKIRFYKRPLANITETVQPIYQIISGSKVSTGINQSFANVNLSQLETFAGDVRRVKVFRTSQGDISDYDLIQDIYVEAKELLTTYDLSSSVVGLTGIFNSEVLNNFWNSGTLTSQLSNDRIENGVKLNGSGLFTYTSSLNFNKGNTYELNLDAFYSSSTSSDMVVYIVSGSVSSSIATINGITPTKNLLDTTYQFEVDSTYESASLYFSQSQGEWHLGNISLKLTEDTAFSPDEITFVTTMPTVVGNETYNFKFEFYDVNNNYVPVNVTQSAVFTGGTTIQSLATSIDSSSLASSASLYAVSQSISGTVTFNSSSVSGSIVTLSGSVSSSLSSSIGYTSASVTTLSGSVSSSISSLSSSVSSSNATILSSSLSKVQQLANGQYSGSFIGDTTIYSPAIGGQVGYIKELFKVGDTSAATINLDARTTTRKIWIGTDSNGTYNSSNTSVYLDSGGQFSLKDKLTWNGTTLTVAGTINANAGTFSGNITSTATISGGTISGGAISGGTISIGSGNNIFKADSNGIYLGNATYASAPFRVSPAGVLTASGANISGAITATSLTLSGATVPASGVTGLAAVATSGAKSDIGLGSVDNYSAANQAKYGIEAAITIGSGGIAMSGGGYVRGGQSDYNTGTGFFLGYSGGGYKFSIGNGGTKSITWDGSNLTVGGDVTITGTLKVGDNISSLTNDSGFQNNGSAKTGGSVGGWSIGSAYIASNNGATILYADGNLTLSSGGTEKIKITKDSLSTSAGTTSITFGATSDSSGTYSTSHNYYSSWSNSTAASATSAQFTAQGASVILNIPYGGSTQSGLSGTISWNSTLSNFKNISNTTSQYMDVSLYRSDGVLISSKSVNVFYRNDTQGTVSAYSFPYIPGGNASVAFSGLSVGTNYYVSVTVTKTLTSSYVAWVFGATNGATYAYYGMTGAGNTIDITSAEEKTSIGVNGMIASSAGGFAQVGPVASIGGTAYSAAFLGNVRVNGEIQASTLITTSDERLKTNINDIESPLLQIEKLKPKSFIWNNKLAPFSDQKNSYGFIAQEVQKDFPFLVQNIGDNADYEGVLSLDYNAIIPINTAAIKELLKKIEELEERILELENQ